MDQKKEERIPIKSLRTFQGDIEEAIAKNKYSASTIMLAEQKRKERDNSPIEAVSIEKRNNFFVFLGLSLLLLGILSVGVVYYLRSRDKITVDQGPRTLVSFSLEKILPTTNLTREQFVAEILSQKQSFKLPVNSVLYINTTEFESHPVNIGDVLSLLFPNMPPSLARSFEGNYMLGIYSYDTNEPFLVLTTNDYALSYAGMLKWESDIPFDLAKIFSISNEASSTNTFSDETLKNQDLRVLKDSNKKTVLLYSFINRNTLLLTKNETIFSAILGKYLISKQSR